MNVKSELLRFVEKLNGVTECWEWKASLRSEKTGYGCFSTNGKTESAHRVSYRMFKGEVPDGMQIDHLCRNRLCVNPNHLEAVSQKENLMRGVGITAVNAKKTHCINGHPFSHENTGFNSRGRRCRACGRANARKNYKSKEKRVSSLSKRSETRP